MTASLAVPFIHRGLGPMIRLTVAEGLSFDLTPQEARILSRAMAAVREGKSKVDEIYMSPIAADADFSAKVTPDGLLLETRQPPHAIAWDEVGTLAASLAALAPEESGSA
ncbi:MAG TPA: hypothetical protein VEQ35_04125 [Beijerinckia sp.]|jgi:hypothetical protein|nr:hypothetical protein [Beijerinckia sp.]